jgi:nitroreductase
MGFNETDGRRHVYEAVTSRRAVRGFKDEPVSRVVLERVLSAAAWSPSGLNIQPWNIYVLTGAPLAELKTRAVERVCQRSRSSAASYLRGGTRGPFHADVRALLRIDLAFQAARHGGVPTPCCFAAATLRSTIRRPRDVMALRVSAVLAGCSRAGSTRAPLPHVVAASPMATPRSSTDTRHGQADRRSVSGFPRPLGQSHRDRGL